MSSAKDTLAAIGEVLDHAGARYMVVGSFASTFHGEPRTTMDIDLVMDATADELEEFVSTLSEDRWYVDAEAAREAHRQRSMFNVIDQTTGWKVDVICLRDSAFARSEFSRRVQGDIFGVPTFVATAEDTLLAKLRWARDSGSERQLRDVIGIIAASGAQLDRSYLDHWATELELSESWRAAAAAAEDTTDPS
jgi:hypothetical protein